MKLHESKRAERSSHIENIRNWSDDFDKLTVERMIAAEAFLNRMKPSVFLLNSNWSFIWHHIWLDIIEQSRNIKSVRGLLRSLYITRTDEDTALNYIKQWKNNTNNYAIIIKSNDGRSFSINSVQRPDWNIQFTIKEESKITNFDQANANHAKKILVLIDRRKTKILNLLKIYDTAQDKNSLIPWIWTEIWKFRREIERIKNLPIFYNQFNNIKNIEKEAKFDWQERLLLWTNILNWTKQLDQNERNTYANMLDFLNYAIPIFLFSPEWRIVHVLSGKTPYVHSNLAEYFTRQFALTWAKWQKIIDDINYKLNDPNVDQFIVKINTKVLSISCMNDISQWKSNWKRWFQATLTPFKLDWIHNMINWKTVDNFIKTYLKSKFWNRTRNHKNDLKTSVNKFYTLISALETMARNTQL